jgi:hypothetical protein
MKISHPLGLTVKFLGNHWRTKVLYTELWTESAWIANLEEKGC